MSRLLAEVRHKVDEENLGQSCSRDGCRVYMTDIPSTRVVVDMEAVFNKRRLPGKCCDFILFCQKSGKPPIIAPLELKSGDADTSGVAGQLQTGATFIQDLVSEKFHPTVRPILFHGRGLHPKQRRDLNRAKVRFRGVDLSIKTARCGRRRNLAEALSPHLSG